MSRKTEDMDEVLVKYLLGEATPEEGVVVQQWIAADKANQRYFDNFKLIWDESKKLAAQSTINEEEAWQRFTRRIQADEGTVPRQPVRNTIAINSYSWMKMAAMLVLLIGCGAFYYYTAGPGSMVTEVAGDHTLVAKLPDGSMVTLNRNASITYPAHFSSDTRSVTLKGEGFFNVTPDKKKPFIITADNSSIKVVGTSFNVKSASGVTEVIVETGIVEVSKKHLGIRVMPHEKALVLPTRDTPVKQNNEDDLYNYYRTKKFVCSDITLKRLADILNEAYDAHIVIEDASVANTKINTTFEEGPLDDILNVIKVTYNVNVVKNGSVIVIK